MSYKHKKQSLTTNIMHYFIKNLLKHARKCRNKTLKKLKRFKNSITSFSLVNMQSLKISGIIRIKENRIKLSL